MLLTPKHFAHYCIILVIALITLGCADETAQSAAISSSIEKQFGVSIIKLTEIEQLPSSKIYKIKRGEADVKMNPPTQKEYNNYLKIVKTALEKYPAGIVKKHLRQIGIGGPYRENGGIIAGMYEKDYLYLFYNHPQNDNSNIFLEQTIHHEFSSILIQHYDFPAFDWLKLNPKNFEYIINPSKINDYMNTIKSYEANHTQLSMGLVSSYGQANAENDINTYVELIFTQPEKMKTYINKYPRTVPKYDMIKRFYLSISPEFNTRFNSIR